METVTTNPSSLRHVRPVAAAAASSREIQPVLRQPCGFGIALQRAHCGVFQWSGVLQSQHAKPGAICELACITYES